MLTHVTFHPRKSLSAPPSNSWMGLLSSQNPDHFPRITPADVMTKLVQAVDPLLEDSSRHLVLELREVDYVSSSVLQFLMEAQDRIKKKGGCTSLVEAGPVVRSAIEMAHLTSLFSFYETLEELGISPPAPLASKPAPAGPSNKPTPTPPASRPARPGIESPPGGPRRSSPGLARCGTPSSGASGGGWPP